MAKKYEIAEVLGEVFYDGDTTDEMRSVLVGGFTRGRRSRDSVVVDDETVSTQVVLAGMESLHDLGYLAGRLTDTSTTGDDDV